MVPSVLHFAVATLVPGLIFFLAVPLWIRTFGATAYASYAVSWAVVMSVSALGTGWLRQAILRFAGLPTSGLRRYPPLILASTMLVVGVGAAGLITLLAPNGTGNDRAFALGVAAFGLAMAAFSVAQAQLQRDGRSLRFSAAECWRAVATVGGSLALGVAGVSGENAMIWASAFAALTAWFIARSAPVLDMRPASVSWALVRRSWTYGWPMSLWLFAAALTLYCDRFVMSQFVSRNELGLYSATSDLVVRGVAMMALPLLLTIHPAIMRWHNEGRADEAEELIRRWSRRAVGMLVVLSAVLLVAGPFSLSLVGVPDADRWVVVMMGLGAGTWQFAMLAHKRLELLGRTRLLLSLLVVAVTIEIVFAVTLVPLFGARGAAAGLLVGSLSYLGLVQMVQMARRREVLW